MLQFCCVNWSCSPSLVLKLTLCTCVSDCVSTGFQVKGGSDRQMPLLRDLFEAFPDMPVNIDVKINNDDLIEKVRTIKLSASL